MGNTSSLSKLIHDPHTKKNLENAFKSFDKDKNGYIENAEIDTFIREVLDYFVKNHPKEQISAFVPIHSSRELSFSEFKEAPKILQENILKRFRKTLLDILDTNKDGKISLDEWLKMDWAKFTNLIQTSNSDIQFCAPKTDRKKKALIIGVNYTNCKKTNKLKGCVNDANNMKRFLIDHYSYQEASIRLLTDDVDPKSEKYSGYDNIMKSIRWLVDEADEKTNLFFYFSGHGGQAAASNNDEPDDKDETIFPADWEEELWITDNDLNREMVQPLPKGCILNALFDCCHSGTLLDLPFVFDRVSRTFQVPPRSTSLGHRIENFVIDMNLEELIRLKGSNRQRESKALTKHETDRIQKRGSPASVYMFSACKEDQTALDKSFDGTHQGAVTFAYRELIENNPQVAYKDMCEKLNDILFWLAKGPLQVSVFSVSNKDVDISQPFKL